MHRTLCLLCLLPVCRPMLGAADPWDHAISAAERLQSEGKLAEASNALLAVMKEATSSTIRLAYTHTTLGSIAQDQGRYADAENYYRRALLEWKEAGGQLGLARTMNNLASLLFVTGKLDAADEFLRQSEDLQIEVMGSDHPEIARILQNRGLIYLIQRRYKQAEPRLHRALEIWEKSGEPRDLETACTMRGLAVLCRQTGRPREAEVFDARSRMLLEQQVAAGHASAETLGSLAELYIESRNPNLAEPLLSQAILLLERQVGTDHPLLARLFRLNAAVYRDTGRRGEAKQMEERAKQVDSACSQALMARQTVNAADLIVRKEK